MASHWWGINDEDFVIRNAFERWLNGINSHSLNVRNPLALAPGGYTVDADVTQYGKQGNTLKKYRFLGMFPQDVSPIDVDVDGILSLGLVELYQQGVNAGFRAIAKPESVLFRSPYGRFYGNEATRMIVENAQRNGIEITSDMWQNQIRPLSQEYALKQVENTFYAIRRMNNVQYYSRFLLGFPTAMFNSVKFWVR